jgi:multisubunit Na+/H+ antiporter MnhG subunit
MKMEYKYKDRRWFYCLIAFWVLRGPLDSVFGRLSGRDPSFVTTGAVVLVMLTAIISAFTDRGGWSWLRRILCLYFIWMTYPLLAYAINIPLHMSRVNGQFEIYPFMNGRSEVARLGYFLAGIPFILLIIRRSTLFVEQVNPYWVFMSRPNSRVLLHKASCGACKDGKGMHGHQEAGCEWKGFLTRGDALTYATSLATGLGVSEKCCDLCSP